MPEIGGIALARHAHEDTSDLAKPYALERFTTGALIDEHGAAGVAH